MGDIHDDLREVMGLLGKATPGPWERGRGGKYEPATSVYCDDALGSIVATCAHSTNVLVTRESEAANAALIAAAVNFLRQHGPALLAAAKYEEANPLGGPATMLEAAAGRIRAGEDFHEVLADYGLLARQEGEDTERLDWLDKHAVSVAYERKLSPASTHSAVAIIRHPMAEGHGTVRAFVDAARSGAGG